MIQIKLYLVSMGILIPMFLEAQSIAIRGTIVDEQNQGIPYAAIGIPGSTIGTVTNSDGNYELWLEEKETEELLKISSLGYEAITIKASALKNNPILPLKAQVTTLNPVVVKAGKRVKKNLGTERMKSSMSTNLAIGKYPSQNLGAAMGKKFFPGAGTFYPDTFSFYLAYTTYDTTVLKVMIYDVERGKPGKPLLHANCLVTLYGKQKGWIHVDLTSYHLALEDNFIVAVEWVGASAKGTHLGLPIKLPWPGSEHFYRYGSQNKWKRFIGMTTPMVIKGISVK